MINAIDIEVMNKVLSSVAEEMGLVLQKAAFSANIKERRDFSCAIFDNLGRLTAQAAHVPVHLGSMPDTVSHLLEKFSFKPGDVAVTNDPFAGGSHLPDITLMSVVFSKRGDKPLFYVVSRAHHADVGGITPGSMPLATSIHEEGIIIEPHLLIDSGVVDTEFKKNVFGKMRRPRERYGDLNAQIASLKRGIERLEEIIEKNGEARLLKIVDSLLDYGSRVMEDTIEKIPDGSYFFEDFLDDDGISTFKIPIRVNVEIDGSNAKLDFTKTADQVKSCVNTVKSVTCAACYYIFFSLAGDGYPVNHGSLSPISVVTRKGSLLDAQYPFPVAAGNVETSQRVVDVISGALFKAIPDRVPAAGCGSMNNIAIGGIDSSGDEFTYYETIGGGMGGGFGCEGLSGVQVHMTNTLNTPVEVIEQSYPFTVERYTLRKGSGGSGKWRGGDGIVRRYHFTEPAKVTLLTERRVMGPYGLAGGCAGKTGKNLLFRKDGKQTEALSGKVNFEVGAGDSVEIHTPGGGGYGR